MFGNKKKIKDLEKRLQRLAERVGDVELASSITIPMGAPDGQKIEGTTTTSRPFISLGITRVLRTTLRHLSLDLYAVCMEDGDIEVVLREVRE